MWEEERAPKRSPKSGGMSYNKTKIEPWWFSQPEEEIIVA